MQGETEKLIVQVKRADKLALERIAQAEGEAVSVIVRRMLKQALHALDDQARPDQGREGQPCKN